MPATLSTSLAAVLLLLLNVIAWSAPIGHDKRELLKDIEDVQPELHMLQMGAHVLTHDEHEEPVGNSSGSASTARMIVGLQGQLLRMQREMEEQRTLYQQLVSDDRLNPSVRGAAASPRASNSSHKRQNSSRLAEAPPPNWPGNRMNLLPTPYPLPTREERLADPPRKWIWTGPPVEVSNWPQSMPQAEWVDSIKSEDEELAEYFEEKNAEIKKAKMVSIIFISMIVVFVLAHIMQEYDIHVLPEGVMVILVGSVLGCILKYHCHARMMLDAEFRAEVAIQLLNAVFLPMLMLEAGWNVRRMDFISQLPYIINFAVLGTLISTVVIAALIYVSGQIGFHTIETARGAFVIASLISATDPVATLGTYSDLKVDPLLNIIVFGEAAINDAVAIVIFSIVNNDYVMQTHACNLADMVFYGTYCGVVTLTCSFMLAGFISTAICMTLKWVGMSRNKKIEILVVVLGGYLSFSVGEYFRVSGIICTLFNGMFMGKYAKHHLSKEGSLLTTFYISEMSTLMDSARVFSTIPCGVLSNYMKRKFKCRPGETEAEMHILTPKYLFMIWHAGLRGGIAENLALQIGPWLDEIDGPGSKQNVRSSVFLLVGCYVIVFGGTTKGFLKLLGIPIGCENPEDALSKTEIVHSEAKVVNWLDQKVFFPLLVGKRADGQNQDVVEGIDDENILEVLTEVCHGHRGAAMRKKQPVEADTMAASAK